MSNKTQKMVLTDDIAVNLSNASGSFADKVTADELAALNKIKAPVIKAAAKYANSNWFNRGWRKRKLDKAAKKFDKASRVLLTLDNFNSFTGGNKQ